MKLKIYHVDAFTDTVFKGNYAAVILIEEWLEDDLMQSISTENNLSETAFAKRNTDTSYDIRWFSPISEIDFCGHATIATAFILFQKYSDLKKVNFFAQAVGHLTLTQADDNYIEMVSPIRKPETLTSVPEELLAGLSIAPKEVLINPQAYFAIYEDQNDVFSLKVELDKIKKLAPYDVVATAPAEEYDFTSRYFWPANGGDEDPATGSIHTGLAPFWAEKLGKNSLLAYQASQRGGKLKCKVKEEKVIIAGQAVLYLEGYIQI